MAPQTRSSAKQSPGRMTRNSIFGRAPPPPSKTRNSSPAKSSARSAPAHGTEAEHEATYNVSTTKGTPWLACRDAYGVATTVALSDTGEGIHIRWYYPEDDCEVDEDDDADVEMTVDDERGVTPSAPATSGDATRRPFPHTPMALQPYDAGSVIRTPVKRARPLQQSPPRIGDKGVRCLYERSGVLREINGGVTRIILRHPVGSSANLSREQVERLEDERELQIVRQQVEKLLAEKERIDEEERQFSDSGYEGEMEMDPLPSFRRSLTREGTNGTILVSHDELSDVAPMESTSKFFRGPDGELLDHEGRQMFGREGTVLMDSNNEFPRRIMREKAFVVSTVSVDHSSLDDGASEVTRMRRARFGPDGTELVD